MLEKIEMVRVFGSLSRGDNDNNSDLDILVVYQNSINEDTRLELQQHLETIFLREISCSWYSSQKLDQYFNDGHLFAWHLFLQSKQISGLPDNYKRIFQKPAEYKLYKEDIRSLIKIMNSITKSIKFSHSSIVYEAGLLYVCCRNIAMAASLFLSDTLQFGRYSPFELNNSKVSFPVGKENYKVLVNSRIASMRGISPPILVKDEIFEIANSLIRWAKQILSELKK